ACCVTHLPRAQTGRLRDLGQPRVWPHPTPVPDPALRARRPSVAACPAAYPQELSPSSTSRQYSLSAIIAPGWQVLTGAHLCSAIQDSETHTQHVLAWKRLARAVCAFALPRASGALGCVDRVVARGMAGGVTGDGVMRAYGLLAALSLLLLVDDVEGPLHLQATIRPLAAQGLPKLVDLHRQRANARPIGRGKDRMGRGSRVKALALLGKLLYAREDTVSLVLARFFAESTLDNDRLKRRELGFPGCGSHIDSSIEGCDLSRGTRYSWAPPWYAST